VLVAARFCKRRRVQNPMEGGQEPLGRPQVSRGRVQRSRTLKAPSSRAFFGGRCGGRPPLVSGFDRRSPGPSGLGGRWSPRFVVVHSSHVRIARFARLQLAETSAAVVSRTANSPSNSATSRNSGPDSSLERRSQGGSKAAAHRSQLIVRRRSSDRRTAKSEGRRVFRHVMTWAVAASRWNEPGRSPEHRSKGGSKAIARGPELVVGRWSSDRWTAEGEGQRVIRHATTRAVSVHGTASRVGRPSAAHKAVRRRQPEGRSSSPDSGLRIAGRRRVKVNG
jgi:hypothetical protein